MKTKELMIGDWVDDGNGFPMQVTGLFDNDTAYLDFEGNEGDVWEEEVKDLKPIPITPEILEKNGFNKYGSTFLAPHIGPFSVAIKETDSRLNPRYKWGAKVSALHRLSGDVFINYVHELQQLLNFGLTGIKIKL